MSRGETRNAVLDVAEQLFAERGFHGVSLRQIAEQAQMAVSLVQYHFGNKEALFGEVLGRRIAAINHARLKRLDDAEHGHGAARPRLEDVLRAFLEPTVLLAHDKSAGGKAYAQLIAQISNNPQEYARKIAREHTDPIARQTIRVLALALPELDEEALAWGYLFSVGAMVAAISPTGRIKRLTNDRADPEDVDRILAYLVPFLTAGFEAIRRRGG